MSRLFESRIGQEARKDNTVRKMIAKTKIFYAIVLAALLTGFAFQVKESVVKYLQGKTTTTIEWKEEKALTFPAMSFCPGFRKGSLKPVKIPNRAFPLLSYWDTHDVAPGAEIDESELKKWWYDSIFPPSEVFDFIQPPQDHHEASPESAEESRILGEDLTVNHKQIQTHDSEQVSIKSVITNYGACYTLNFHEPVSARKAAFLKLNMTGKTHIAIYIHSPGHEIGLYGNYWPAFVSQQVLTHDRNTIDFPLMKEVMSSTPGDSERCIQDENYNYADCLLQFAKRTYLNAKCSSICWFPQSLYITSNLTIPPCLTDQDTKCMSNHLVLNIIEKSERKSITGCKPECAQIRYMYNARQEVIGPHEEEVAFMFLFFESTVYSIFEEYVLYDENTIIAAVGGSLGLFLGLSCFQAVQMLTNCSKKAIENHCSTSTEVQNYSINNSLQVKDTTILSLDKKSWSAVLHCTSCS